MALQERGMSDGVSVRVGKISLQGVRFFAKPVHVLTALFCIS